MKYCFQCGRTTAGEPLFCNFCGRSFDVKLCPRLHPNPRIAKVCSQCGSRELSEPQPRVSFWWHLLGYHVRILAGTALVYLSLSFLVALVHAFLASPQLQAGMVALAFLIAGLWFLWSMLPEWMRKLVRRLVQRKERKHDH
jgi:hypothetical protein